MKLAVIGSRKIRKIDIASHIPDGVDEIISGGAIGVDRWAAEYAEKSGIKFTVFLPQYERYGRAAPIVRNKEIVNCADKVIAFWDGSSRGTLSVIKYSEKIGKECLVILCEDEE